MRFGVLLSVFLITFLQASSPSFNCAKATTFIEKSICSSDLLAIEDNELSTLYSQALHETSGDEKATLKQQQREWLRGNLTACANVKNSPKELEKCILQRYQERSSQLSSEQTFEELKILRVVPHGNDVLPSRQIVFQFDKPVVPIGRMERDSKDIPIEISPQLNCEWRWLNTSALACQLTEQNKMQEATKYTITVEPGIKTVEGARMQDKYESEFITARPKVRFTRFVNWLSPTMPLIQVTFNTPVTKDSVEQTLSMQARRVENSPKVGVVVYPDNLQRELPYWAQNRVSHVNDQKTMKNGVEARKVWLVKPTQELPKNQTIWFDVAPGLESVNGDEKGIEERTIVSFETYPDFRFVGIRCTPKGEKYAKDIMYEKLTTQGDLQECAPLKPIALIFSSPVLNSAVKNSVTFTPKLSGDRKDYDPWANSRDYSHLSYAHRTGRTYKVWLPDLLQAYQTYRVKIDSKNFTDEFDRRLANPIDFEFFTAHREPRLSMTHSVAILEKGVDSDVPMYVTNLDSVAVNYQTLYKDHQTATLDIQQIEDVSYKRSLGIRDLLHNRSGVLYGSLTPNPKPVNYYRDPQIFVQVTPFSVHAKIGHFSSLIWVTNFANKKAVSHARVTLCKGSYYDLKNIQELSYVGVTDKEGRINFPGTATFDPELKMFGWYLREDAPRLFVKVQKGIDVALLPLDDRFLVRNNGVYSYMKRYGQHARAWGTTAQGVYKLGDEVEFKIYVRDQSNTKWVEPSSGPYKLSVNDPQGKLIYENKNVYLSEFGSFDGKFIIPKNGTTGQYRFSIYKEGMDTLYPMRVLVSDFTPSPFKVQTELNGKLFKADDKVKVDSFATLHSGGAYGNAEIRVTARLSKKSFSTSSPLAKGFYFGSDSGTYLSSAKSQLLDLHGKLNDKGEFKQSFVLPKTDIYYGSILVESAVKDERGKFITSTASADFSGRDRFVGLKKDKWIFSKDKNESINMIVVDDKGKVKAGVDVNVTIEYLEYKASRVKGPGNAYLTRNIMTWKQEKSQIITSKKESVKYKFIPKHAGSYRFIATLKDTQGAIHKTTLRAWVSGSGYLAWDQSNDATLQIIPEKNSFKIGEKAKYLIKNPFPGAKALVSIERYGVIDSWVQTLEGSTPIIEVPIKPEYIPGYYLSVVVVSPRVAKPLGLGHIDLGKPSYRMGYVTSNVRDPYKELSFKISTDKKVYKPKQKVKADIEILTQHKEKGEKYELAVAVVDESVLALNKLGNSYYDPYKGFNHLDSLDLKNYNLISRLIGRQKFEKKGVNAGGDGGSEKAFSPLRNLFKYVTYWNPSVKIIKGNKAHIEFELPDNLTGWRVIAFAVTPDDKMGLGTTSFKVNRPTELRPVMPNQVLEGDSFKAGFNIMNRTSKLRNVKVKVDLKGPLKNQKSMQKTFALTLKPYERKNVWLPVQTKGAGELTFRVNGGDKLDRDALEFHLKVHKKRSLETAATYGSTTKSKVSEWVQVPKGIYTDVGHIGVVLSPTVIGNIDGAFNYLKDYPYWCWEQRLSKAAAASQYLELYEYLKESVEWSNAKQTVLKTLQSAQNFQAPNGGMCYWVGANSYVSPYLSAYTALVFEWLKKEGYQIPKQVETDLHAYLLNLLRHDEFPSFYSQGMSSTVRAVALNALSQSNEIDYNDILRYAKFVPQMDLFGKAQFLQASQQTQSVPTSIKSKVVDDILGHASQSGGKFQFNEELDDSYSYILATPLRSNCAVLSALVEVQKDPILGKSVQDIPFKMVRSITQTRGNRDHWENTQENMFCLNAIVDYAKEYESVTPKMQLDVKFDKKKIGSTSFNKKSDPSVRIFKDMTPADEGKKAKIEIDKKGQGRVYYAAQIAYDLKAENASRINSGIEIRREYSVERNGKFVLLKSPMKVKRSEIVKVDLFVSVPTARHFVVVHDPVAGGLEPINTDLATSSVIDAKKGEFKAAEGSWYYEHSDWSYYGRYFWSFYHKELKHDAANFYADYLPAGNYHLSYTAQVIAEGEFHAMSASSEEMYDPDVYGKTLPGDFKVDE
jgi:alpha-2-macroglobulin